jgi:hypothetical protein
MGGGEEEKSVRPAGPATTSPCAVSTPIRETRRKRRQRLLSNGRVRVIQKSEVGGAKEDACSSKCQTASG